MKKDKFSFDIFQTFSWNDQSQQKKRKTVKKEIKKEKREKKESGGEDNSYQTGASDWWIDAKPYITSKIFQIYR